MPTFSQEYLISRVRAAVPHCEKLCGSVAGLGAAASPTYNTQFALIMNSNPLLGVIFHWLGGLASGSFYVPFRAVKRWSWETYWLVGGVFSWIFAPWILGLLMSTDLVGVLREAQTSTLGWCFFWGVLWGFGGLTFGLTMRYLGMSLGMAMVLGYCAAFGTLMPPIFDGQFGSQVLGTVS